MLFLRAAGSIGGWLAAPPGSDDRKEAITPLLDLGATYVEAGCNAAIAGVRIPAYGFGYVPVPARGGKEHRRIVFDPAMSRKAATCLIRLREPCS